jgi:D-glycero-D-manno-heptose 1,7-bisphosphate phosphatase
MKRKAAFLDRDGTIIREAEYLADPAGVELLAGSVPGIQALRKAGFLVVVTSNQSGVARGFFDEATVKRVNQRMQDLLNAQGAPLDGIYYCPHYPKGQVADYAKVCDCRKPAPGMLEAAAKALDIDLTESWVVGDKAGDVEFGLRAGLRTVLVLTGYGLETQTKGFPPGLEPDRIVADLAAAAEAILAESSPEQPR